MIRVLVLPSDSNHNLAPEVIRALTLSAKRFHVAPNHPSFAALNALGFSCEPLPENYPDNGLIIVPGEPVGADRYAQALGELVQVVDRLLGPGGCPWDQAQTHESLKRYLLEEAYEVLDAIDAQSPDKLAEELGDLLLQPILHAQIAKKNGRFDTEIVARGIVDKLVRRHPHVFGDVSVADADEVLRNWDRLKSEEKGGKPESLLAGVPIGMASLLRAYEVSKRAARAGFEWPNIEGVFEKLREEEFELREAIVSKIPEHIGAEIGDLLFTVVNIARWSNVEPEEALRQMLNRFTTRFQAMENAAEKPLEDLSPEEWDSLWNASKQSVG